MTVKDIKEYIIDFENSDKFIDESNIYYVIATKKPTVDDLIKIDSIKDFMSDYGFNVITNIEEVKKGDTWYNPNCYDFDFVYCCIAKYPWMFRDNSLRSWMIKNN